MLIDWITARIQLAGLLAEQVREIQRRQDLVVRFTGEGEVVWATNAWDSIRSDSHKLSIRVSSDCLWMQGSPARIIGDADNVFSSGPSAALDLLACVQRMACFVSAALQIDLPLNPENYRVSRVDVTQNLELDSLEAVRVALSILRNCEGGRYRVSQQAGDTVYWSHKSRLRSGKAYAKGPHLLYAMKKREQHTRQYTPEEIHAASRLLRLELKLGAQYWRERAGKPWYDITPADLETEWKNYFERMIGGAEVKQDTDIYKRILAVVDTDKDGKPKETLARSAYGTWSLIKSESWERAKSMYAKSTWYRNLKILRNAGLSDADISAGNVVQLRRKIIECRAVNTWSDILPLVA